MAVSWRIAILAATLAVKSFMMKILMLSDVYFPRVNGVSTSIESFRGALERQGHQVNLICPRYTDHDEAGPQIWRIDSRGVLGDPEDRMMRYRAIMALATRLQANEFDLIHIHTPFVAHYAGVALSKRLGIPVIGTYHTLFEEYLHHYVPWLPRRCLRFAARRFSVHQCQQLATVVAPSSAMAAALNAYGVRTSVATIATGLSLTRFTTQTVGAHFRERHGLPKHGRLLLFVGRAAHEKNIDFLIDMLPEVHRHHPETHLAVVGEGPALASLKQQAEYAGLLNSVHFLGYLPRDGALQDAYRAADVFVFASRTETQGLVLLEALALGTPVVSTAIMGTQDVLQQDEGCLIAEEHRSHFAEQINRLLDDDALRTRLAQRGRIYAQRWNEDTQAEALATLYDTLCPKALASTPA
ncbi:glycosyltransferase [Halomonas meridiana]|jgi:hypothetical protein|uniref:glycosyltransferase n=1 Tax=Halomonadaceae TaxID=28256 RepID=UPI001E5C8888|nr:MULTISPECIES: glycosyltransferase [Halomonas]MCD1652261.1 glycosyltransferase [Halomonas axialensis]MCD2088350.1 glycosyltransferase [Halomonas meridiana]MEC9304148.1 glycosyltransferase [Pseudomonadota bacterium]